MRFSFVATLVVLVCFTPLANADTVTLYSDLVSYQNALASLGLTEDVIDFETLPDGTPVGSGDVFRTNTEVFDLFGATNSATFSTSSRFVYEDFVSSSPTHSLRENGSAQISVTLSSPIAAVGAFAIDIDNIVDEAAWATYGFTTLADVTQVFDNNPGSDNATTFFGAIATNDSLTVAVPIINQIVYDQSNASTPEFTYLDDLRFSAASEARIVFELDIKPGSDKNPINLNSKGVLPVALLGTDEFDVFDVDIDSLLFGDPNLVDNGGSAVSPTRIAYEDVSDDGLLDLTLKFSMRELVDFGALGSDTKKGRLIGELLDGTLFEGVDSIHIVPQNRSDGSSSSVIVTVPEPTTFALVIAALCFAMKRHNK